jgi:hypothetical protein
MPLFEVALIQHPTKKEEEAGGQEKLILAPKAVIAKDAQSAGVVAVHEHREAIECDITKVEVIVRPFVG